ncbi:cellulase family glycosylhydrolase [Glaciecola sp. MH2013]|uniref:cellulase family glycosylhydrolase n=1 Tax=Glaciecola sp. MH2013 TaxID=2785524 RepID=UPI00189FF486|nr:cellulase family glycosylhydrolase [Glaciecola sp. MH2013]MBF7073741.1 cellulase family glycosylhydrolase [Glaciecola sp. MH2013]
MKNLFKKTSTLAGLILASALTITPAAAVDPITVNGSKVLIGGEEKGLAGNSYFWTNNTWGGAPFYNQDTVRWLKQDWNSRIVRAAMGVDEGNGNYLDSRTANVNRVKALVDAAIAEDLYVIIDWHSHHAEDYESEAIEFFEEMAQTYGTYDNVIYEIYNEPLQDTDWSSTIKPYSEAVIAKIRAIDPDNLIIVGTQTWSQEVEKAADDPILGYDNIAYTLHFYAGTHTQWLRDRAERAMNKGIALVVTEWGTTNYSGNGPIYLEESQRWVDWMQDNNITHLNWSVNDKNESASIVKNGASTTGNWSNADLTDSGRWVRNMIRQFNGPNDGGGSAEPSNNPPTVDLVIPTSNRTVEEGYSLVVEVDPKDSDGSIDFVKLYINGAFVRVENYRPYEWGHAGSPNPSELNNLPVGNHTIRIEATDNDGSTGSNSFNLTVVEADNGSGGSTGGGTGGDGNNDCQTYNGKARVELDLTSASCVRFSGGLTGKTLQLWDSDTNNSCDFRGSISSTNGSGSASISSNDKKVTGFTGDTIQFTSNNNCRFIKVRRY